MNDPTDPPLRLTAVDDHPFVLNGIRRTVRDRAPWVQVIGPPCTVAELTAGRIGEPAGGPGQGPPPTAPAAVDVVILNLDRPSGGGDPAADVRAIRRAGAQVLLVTEREQPDPLCRAVAAGAAGLVGPADPAGRLVHALRSVRVGAPVVGERLARALLTDRSWVTLLAPRFVRAFELLATGLAPADIGSRLDPPVAAATVRAYLHHGIGLYRTARRDPRATAGPDRPDRPAPAPLAAMGWDERGIDGVVRAPAPYAGGAPPVPEHR